MLDTPSLDKWLKRFAFGTSSDYEGGIFVEARRAELLALRGHFALRVAPLAH